MRTLVLHVRTGLRCCFRACADGAHTMRGHVTERVPPGDVSQRGHVILVDHARTGLQTQQHTTRALLCLFVTQL